MKLSEIAVLARGSADATHGALPREVERLIGKQMLKMIELIRSQHTALSKIEDPRLRDHQEPDKYTECGCMMNMATEALAKEKELDIEVD